MRAISFFSQLLTALFLESILGCIRLELFLGCSHWLGRLRRPCCYVSLGLLKRSTLDCIKLGLLLRCSHWLGRLRQPRCYIRLGYCWGVSVGSAADRELGYNCVICLIVLNNSVKLKFFKFAAKIILKLLSLVVLTSDVCSNLLVFGTKRV